MIRWSRGQAVIERLLEEGALQQVTGAQTQGEPWLEKARKTLEAASAVTEIDPASACTLAYDAARFACTALLAQQGLRSTTRGGHLAVEDAVRAQFGEGFKPFRNLRIRRNELEYPAYADEDVEAEEATQSLDVARSIMEAASSLLPNLRIF